VHPTLKLIAQFPDVVNSADMGVPVHQVKEFAPRLSFGCSISSRPYLALGLIDHPEAARNTLRDWQNLAVYYAMITSEGRGTVRGLPGSVILWCAVRSHEPTGAISRTACANSQKSFSRPGRPRFIPALHADRCCAAVVV
jgi:hypothetical protein